MDGERRMNDLPSSVFRPPSFHPIILFLSAVQTLIRFGRNSPVFRRHPLELYSESPVAQPDYKERVLDSCIQAACPNGQGYKQNAIFMLPVEGNLGGRGYGAAVVGNASSG